MGIMWTVLIGFVVGLLATALTPGRETSDFFIIVATGMAGSLLATFAGQALGLYQAGQPAAFAGALIGAIILILVVYHVVRRKTAT